MTAIVNLPMRELLSPTTAPILHTVKGKALSIKTGTLSAVGHDGLTHVIPVIEKFDITDEHDVPISEFGTYLTNQLLPNTIYRTLKHASIGIFKTLRKGLTGNDADNKPEGFINDVIVPFYEAFTKDLIMGGAGLTVEQLSDYTGINHKDMGTEKLGSGNSGGSYSGIKMKDMTRDHGRGFGRVLGTSGYDGLKGVRSALEKNFGKEYKTIMGNTDFMNGIYEGVAEGKKYKGYVSKDKFEIPDYYAADDYFYKKAANL